MSAKHGHDVAVSYLANNSSNFQSPDKYTGYNPALHAYSQEYYMGYDAFPPTFNRQYSPQCHFNRYTGVQSVQHYFHPMAYPSHQQTSDYSSQYMQTYLRQLNHMTIMANKVIVINLFSNRVHM